jgi:hypothetical protein
VIVLVAYPTIFFPLGRDQGIFAYIGKIINEGGVPFIDAWEQKPPLAYYLYSFAFMLFGESMQSVRIFDLLYTVIAVILLSRLGTLLFGETVGLTAGLFYGALYFFTNDFWTLANTDSFLILPTIGALYTCCVAQVKNKKLLFLLSGLLCGCIFMIKSPGILVLVPLFLFMLMKTLEDEKKRFGTFFLNFFLILSGIAAAIIPFIIYFKLNSALDEMLYTLFVFNPLYAKGAFQVTEREYLDLTLTGFSKKTLVVTVPALFALLRVRLKKPCAQEVLAVSWLGVTLLGVYMQWRFFLYHWLPVLGPLSLLGAYGICQMFRKPAQGDYSRAFLGVKNLALVVVFILLALSTFKPFARHFFDFYKYKRGSISKEVYYNTHFGRYNFKDFSFLADEEVAEYVKEHTQESDYIFIWGFGTLIYFLSDRSSPSRFVFPNALLTKSHPKYEEWRRELIDGLISKKPVYILVVEQDALPWVTGVKGDSLENLKYFPELNQILEHHYSLETVIEHFHLYRLKV